MEQHYINQDFKFESIIMHQVGRNL